MSLSSQIKVEAVVEVPGSKGEHVSVLLGPTDPIWEGDQARYRALAKGCAEHYGVKAYTTVDECGDVRLTFWCCLEEDKHGAGWNAYIHIPPPFLPCLPPKLSLVKIN